jgi:hypothetical protein
VRFAVFLSGGFTTMAVMNPPEKKQEKRTSVHWVGFLVTLSISPSVDIEETIVCLQK